MEIIIGNCYLLRTESSVQELIAIDGRVVTVTSAYEASNTFYIKELTTTYIFRNELFPVQCLSTRRSNVCNTTTK